MNKSLQYVALDVDDKGFHGYAISARKPEGVAFKCKPLVSALVKMLERIRTPGYAFKICYEATYLGYALQRDLTRKNYSCEVIAPSLIPKAPGSFVKTDRIDSKRLAVLYQKGLLTPVHIPDETDEEVRDVIRSRGFLLKQLKGLKVHILSNCRRLGLDYRNDTNKPMASYWTGLHKNWLKAQTKQQESSAVKMNLSLLLAELNSLSERLDLYHEEIKRIAQQDQYQRKVRSLICYRSIDVLTAMTLIVELGDIRRFDHPRRLTSYAGMDLIEYSSGGKERRFGMTKMGNRRIRTAVIESSQTVLQTPVVSKPLRQRRQGAEPAMIEIADRAMHRLHKKATRLWHKGKPKNKIKTACARELLSFVWESLNAVA